MSYWALYFLLAQHPALMLEAEVRLQQWASANQLALATIHEIEAGTRFTSLKEVRDEAKVRRLYASVLDHAAEIQGARRQLGIAAELWAEERKGFDAYMELHPLAPADRAKLQSQCSAEAAVAIERRIARIKSELLSSEGKLPATPFRLRSLDGKDVALAGYRGKVVVAVFWATWCAPCMKELEELNRLSDPRAALLTISIDESVNVVAEFARKAGYRFPILKSDGSVEGYTRPATLDSANIPQLYVFDPEGNMRFHIIGYDDDGLFERKLEWMIDAAWK
jgi:thiol-disulfide isomerase/thioredoxin